MHSSLINHFAHDKYRKKHKEKRTAFELSFFLLFIIAFLFLIVNS